ncbi:MAG: AMP-binding protein [Gammaproteobacteria bacterium]|nr:AMP-binding protein [Gammaproteobacteria bacterium]
MSQTSESRASSRNGELNTFPKLLLNHARVRGDKIAMREKDLGIWQSWTWQQVADEVRALACGLASLGFQRGDKLAIIGDNRPKLYMGMAAAQCLGGVPVPLYQDSIAKEMSFVLENADVRYAIAEDQEQVDKLLEIREESDAIKQVLFDDPRGMRHYDYPFLRSIEAAQALGREFDGANPTFFEEQCQLEQGDDIAIMLYTSGTTGQPKGVVLTNDNVIITARNGIIREGLSADEEVLAYLPMAWVGDNLFSYAQSMVAGFTINCPESGATVMTDMREIGPTYYFAPPRIYENLLTQVMIRMEDASRIKQRMFHYFMDLAKRVGTRILDGKEVKGSDKLLYKIGNFLVYGPLRDVLGFNRIRLAYTAGEAIGPEIFDFYRSLGINIKQLYGQTEGMVFICVQPDGEVYPDTVGTPAIDVEVKIDDSGEVIYRSPGVFHSYYKNPESTAKTKTEDGWVYTGDAGYFAENGHLKIIDRAKDVGKMADGSLFAPKFVENKLKFYPNILEAVLFGAGRDHCVAFINIDLNAVGNWAERNNVGYASYQELAGHPQVLDTVQGHVEEVNASLADDPMLNGCQVHRFLILHKELDPDDGEMTRTRKVRRKVIEDKFADLIAALYSGVPEISTRTEVTYEDGRKGAISATLEIRDARVFERKAEAA